MINKHGDERLKAMMREYMIDLHDYQEAMTLKDYVGIEEVKINPNHSCFTHHNCNPGVLLLQKQLEANNNSITAADSRKLCECTYYDNSK